MPAGAVKLLLGEDEQSLIITTPEALQDALLPSPVISENLQPSAPVSPQSITPDP